MIRRCLHSFRRYIIARESYLRPIPCWIIEYVFYIYNTRVFVQLKRDVKRQKKRRNQKRLTYTVLYCIIVVPSFVKILRKKKIIYPILNVSRSSLYIDIWIDIVCTY